MERLTITKFTHHFAITDFDRSVKDAICEYTMRFAKYAIEPNKWGGYNRVVKQIYAVATGNRREYRLPINLLEEFIEFLQSKGISGIKTQVIDVYTPVEIDYIPNPSFTLRSYQPAIIEHILNPGVVKLITLQPGKGKTLCSLFAIYKMRVRVFIVIKPMYIKRWLDDLTGESSFLRLNKDEIYIIQGMDSLVELISLINQGKNIKAIVCSNRTLAMFHDLYMTLNGDYETLGLHPAGLMQWLGVGAVINDEVHQEFLSNFVQYMFMHVPKAIALSGTMETDDDLLGRIYKVLFPIECRKDAGFIDKYIAVRASMYGLNSLAMNSIRYLQRGRGTYSHVAFEQSILKNKLLKSNYLDMIYSVIREHYILKREPGFRALVFAARVDMCVAIKEYLEKKHPELNIVKYTSGDSYEKLKQCDIGVSTIGSAGTAIDIKGLIFSFATTAIDKRETNEQVLYRMRSMPERPDIVPLFYYFVCRDIRKHNDYHEHKKKIFDGKVISHLTTELGRNL